MLCEEELQSATGANTLLRFLETRTTSSSRSLTDTCDLTDYLVLVSFDSTDVMPP